MTLPEAIRLRNDLIRNLELINYILTTPLGKKHPNYAELRSQYNDLKKKLEDGNQDFRSN